MEWQAVEMYRYGLKLWSTNRDYVKEAVRLYEKGGYSYIELFVVPGSYNEHAGIWAGLGIPYIIHAPHFDKGLNLAKRDNLIRNVTLAQETIRYADRLDANIIIFHPGIEGDIKETAYQLHEIYDSRIVVENKPHFGFNNVVCNGSTPEDMDYLMATAHVGFCLDIGHAICAANAKRMDPMTYIQQFMSLGPKMFHLSDGEYNGIRDRHDHIGMGKYPLKDIMLLLPSDSYITVETDKDSTSRLDDFEKDIFLLKMEEQRVS